MSDSSLGHTDSASREIAQALLSWFADQKRDLPWRLTQDPYRIWVSEIMLQQTQVSTVIPYYGRFLRRFPTVQALSIAALDEVLAQWQGLGYYARARSLHRAAQLIAARHQGQVPSSYVEFRKLPGVGDYTACAVLSIAFGQKLAAIDGNARRVLCRLYDYAQAPDTAEGKRALQCYAEALLPDDHPGDLNQATMELGAMVCLPRQPKCPNCPLINLCLAQSRGVQEERPLRRERPPVPHHSVVAIYALRDGRLCLLRRQPEGLLGGLWELPNGPTEPGENEIEAVTRLLRASLGLDGKVDEYLTTVRHAYTHFTVTVHVYRCTLLNDPQARAPWDDARWLGASELEEIGLTGVTTKILARFPWPSQRHGL